MTVVKALQGMLSVEEHLAMPRRDLDSMTTRVKRLKRVVSVHFELICRRSSALLQPNDHIPGSHLIFFSFNNKASLSFRCMRILIRR